MTCDESTSASRCPSTYNVLGAATYPQCCRLKDHTGNHLAWTTGSPIVWER